MGSNQTKQMLSQYFHYVCYKTNLTLVHLLVPSVVFFFHFLLKTSFLTSPISFSFSCHYLISPRSPLPLFFAQLCSWFSVLLMKSCSLRVCLNCILKKKGTTQPLLQPVTTQQMPFLQTFICIIFFAVIYCPHPLYLHKKPFLFSMAYLFLV